MKNLLFFSIILPILLAGDGAQAQAPATPPVDQQVYVTRQDCSRLVAHHTDPGVAYQPGTDVHGHYVPPADLPGGGDIGLPDKVTFDLRLNPLAYAPQSGAPANAFSNTGTNIGHVEVDLASGAVKLNGQSLDGEQTRIVTEACKKAGYR